MLSISHFIFSCFPQWDTPKRNHSCVSIEDAGRVEDPTSLVRPCKTIVDGRSLVLTECNKIVPQRGTST